MTPSQVILSKIFAGHVIQKSHYETHIKQCILMRYNKSEYNEGKILIFVLIPERVL